MDTRIFYKIFKIGIELEGEFYQSPISRVTMWEVKDDCSLDSHHDGWTKELVSPIIKSIKDERKCLSDLVNLERQGKDGSKTFSTSNDTAGTHIHFSFQNLKDDKLYLFDTMRFETFMLNRYINNFKRSKYQARLSNDYCKLNSRGIGDGNGKITFPNTINTPEKKIRFTQEKFRALAAHQIRIGRGAEIRLFPYIRTIKGLQQVIDFTKKLLLEYLRDAETKKEMRLLDDYNKEKNWDVDVDKVGLMERIALNSVFFGRCGSPDRISQIVHGGDERIILATLRKKYPKAFVK